MTLPKLLLSIFSLTLIYAHAKYNVLPLLDQLGMR